MAIRLRELALHFVPAPIITELRHRKNLHDLAKIVEPEDDLIKQIVHAGDTALDIGANLGSFTKLFSELVGPEGSVIAFEPVPQTFRTLTAGIKRFCRDNVQAMNSAVSDKVGTVFMAIPFYEDSAVDNFYRAHITNSADSANKFSVKTLTIDSLRLPRVDFIKIDVEDHELEVLHGCRETIEAHHPTLLVEVSSSITIEYLCKEMKYQPPINTTAVNKLFVHAARSNVYPNAGLCRSADRP